ncbi:B12-binding domain-containing radical SAM protein, partial [Myxococcota bacterium]
MRIALLYPPPWQIPAPALAPPTADGPPRDYQVGDLDGDFCQVPYGLLTLAVTARRAKHQVKVLNLSAFPWSQVLAVVERLEAELYGMSCYTANRRGVASLADAIHVRHPQAHVTVGGPHATAMATEMLAHHQAIDSVAVGEGEHTLLELAERLSQRADLGGLAGLVYRRHGKIERGPPRSPLRDLD